MDQQTPKPIKKSAVSPITSPLKTTFHRANWEAKSTFLCFFCGGKSCKHENWQKNKNTVVKGLNADWITPNILAMQRPSSKLIKEFDLVDQFKTLGINAIFNVQEPGEHVGCGDGVQPASGFSYLPEEFYEKGIFFYNFGWKDMTITKFETILKVIRLMEFSLRDGKKFAVHCHAGKGRTLLAIGSWVIYNDRMKATDFIAMAQTKRTGILSKTVQKKFLIDLEIYLKGMRSIFIFPTRLTFTQVLENQVLAISPGEYRERCKVLPFSIIKISESLHNILQTNSVPALKLLKSFYDPLDENEFAQGWNEAHENQLSKIKDLINAANYSEVMQVSDTRVLAQSILDFYESLAAPVVGYAATRSISEFEDSGREYATEDLFRFMTKLEFHNINIAALMLNAIVQKDPKIKLLPIYLFALRFAIALTHQKKRLDRNFLGRTLLTIYGVENDVIFGLCKFIVKLAQKDPSEIHIEYQKWTSPILRSCLNRTRSKSEFQGGNENKEEVLSNRKLTTDNNKLPPITKSSGQNIQLD
jgi:protein tyrosine phosphatase domain-containing protein 1